MEVSVAITSAEKIILDLFFEAPEVDDCEIRVHVGERVAHLLFETWHFAERSHSTAFRTCERSSKAMKRGLSNVTLCVDGRKNMGGIL